MGSFSLFHWAILIAIVLLLFGAGRIPNVMGDFAKGIKAFKRGMRDDEGDAEQIAAQKVPNDGFQARAAAGQPVAGDHKVD
jgi:sec-independent protein translocase protein TatA